MNWDEAIYIRKKIEKKLDEDNGYGIPPKAMTACSATAGDGQVELSWSLPSDTVVDNQTLVEVEGVVIIRKLGSAPQNISDGVKVTESKLSIGTFVDTNVENGQTYYYRFIPYSTEGAYSMSPDNVVSANPEYIIYGFHDDFTDLNTATRITYPSDVSNYGYTPMMTAPLTGTPTAGSWATFLSDFLKNKPAMVKSDGELDYWLDPSDYTKKLDGTASDVSNTSYSGAGAFAWIDKFYMKEVYDQDGNGRTVYFCKSKLDNDYYPVGFVDENDNELAGLWFPMYLVNDTNEKIIAGTRIRGMSDSTSYSATETMQQKIDRINLLGNRAKPLGGPIFNVLRDLEFMLYKNTDIQTQGGKGTYGSGMWYSHNLSNFILPNGPVSGFRGNTSDSGNDISAKIAKFFHSIVLGYLQGNEIDPYLMSRKEGNTQRLKAAYKYDVDLSLTKYEDIGLVTRFSLGGRSNGYPKRMVHVDKKIGSMPIIEANSNSDASATTGYAASINYGVYAESSSYGYFYYRLSKEQKSIVAFYPSSHSSSLDTWTTNMNRYERIEPLILPPLNYNPNA